MFKESVSFGNRLFKFSQVIISLTYHSNLVQKFPCPKLNPVIKQMLTYRCGC